MAKYFYLSFSALLLTTLIFAQNEVRSVISSAGQTSQATNWTIDWTFGEMAIQTIATESGYITEGFQQPYFTIKDLIAAENTLPDVNLTLQAMPNPVHTNLSVSLSSDLNERGALSLWDMEGHLLRHPAIDLTAQVIEWNMGDYPPGMYFLSLQKADGSLLKTIKISKVSN